MEHTYQVEIQVGQAQVLERLLTSIFHFLGGSEFDPQLRCHENIIAFDSSIEGGFQPCSYLLLISVYMGTINVSVSILQILQSNTRTSEQLRWVRLESFEQLQPHSLKAVSDTVSVYHISTYPETSIPTVKVYTSTIAEYTASRTTFGSAFHVPNPKAGIWCFERSVKYASSTDLSSLRSCACAMSELMKSKTVQQIQWMTTVFDSFGGFHENEASYNSDRKGRRLAIRYRTVERRCSLLRKRWKGWVARGPTVDGDTWLDPSVPNAEGFHRRAGGAWQCTLTLGADVVSFSTCRRFCYHLTCALPTELRSLISAFKWPP